MSIRIQAQLTFFIFSVLLLGGCAKRESNLPTYSAVPQFTMTDSEGREFDSRALRGKVWVADFIYTNCPGPCPRMTSEMHKVQRKVSGDENVELVSISVDPQHDSPKVLNDYAHHFGGPTRDWVFLTGSPKTVHVLAYDVFHVGDVISNMDHSTKFVLVDKRGVIRGYYSSLDGEGMPALLHDVADLKKEAL